MAEYPRQIKEDAPPPHRDRFQPGVGHVSGTHIQPSLHSAPPQQPSKEMFYQQRQKCELRRLLKHTHPELKMLDGVVDEELAEVLCSESGPTAAETGYEGEVLSRRWLFENMCNTEAPKTHMAEGAAEGRASAQNERINETLEASQKDTSANDRDVESEEMVRIDVKSARKMFEGQRVDDFKSSSDSSMFQGKVVISEDETGAMQKRKQKFEKKGKKQKQHKDSGGVSVESIDLAKQCHKQEPCIHVVGSGSKHTFYENQKHKKCVPDTKPVFEDKSVSFPDSFGDSFEETQGFEETVGLIKTSADLFQNNPFISTNMNKEKPHDCETKVSPYGDPATVDNRASEAQVKNRTHLFESMPFHQIMHQNREEMETVVERINETLYSLYHFDAIHSSGSVIEVHETMIATKAKYTLSQTGPEIQYDEVAEGGANNFILQLLPRANLKPQVIYLKEDKEGNVALTLVGVPVHQHQFNAKQDAEFKTANAVQLIEDVLYQDNSLRKGVIIQGDEVTVYSLYRYAEGDVKGYCPPPQGCGIEHGEPEVSAVTNNSKIDIQDIRKGDVKSTISCLLANAQDQGSPVSITPDANMRGNVKLFSSCIEKGNLEFLKTLQAEPAEQEPCPDHQTQALVRDDTETCPTQEDNQVDDPEWVPVDVKKLRNMFSADQRPVQPKPMIRSDAIHSTKYSPGLGKGTHPHLERQGDDLVHKAELMEIFQNEDETGQLQAPISSLPQVTHEAKASFLPHENMEISYTDTASDACGEGQQGTEVVQKGHLKAAIKSLQSAATEVHQEDKEEVIPGNLQSALDSLERSSINVSKGDFKSAMIYRASSKSHKETCKTVSVQNPAETESKSAPCVDSGQLTEEQSSSGTHTDSASDICGEAQQGTEVVQKGHLKAAIKSLQSAATELHQEDKEEVVHGDLRAALDSLEKSSINVARGDFKAAMIYRSSSKSHRETCKTADSMSARKTAENKVGLLPESKSSPCETLGQLQQELDDEHELCNLKAAICSLQQATNEAKELSKHHMASVARSNVEVANAAKAQAEFPPSDDMQEQKAFNTSDLTLKSQHENTETNCTNTDSASETCGAEDQQGTEVVQKGHLKAAIKSLQSAATELHQEDKEEVVHANLQAALDSLERSSVNVSKGDFKAAMIYRGSSKSHKEMCKTVHVHKPEDTESKSAPCEDYSQLTTEEQSSAVAEPVPATGPSSKKSRTATASKPAIPPKPAHLKPNHENNESTNIILSSATMTAETKESKEEQTPQSLPTKSMSYKDALAKGVLQTDCSTKSSPNAHGCEKWDANQLAVEASQMSEEIKLFNPGKGISGASSSVDGGNFSQPEGMPITSEEKSAQNDPAKDNENAVEECPVDFQEARKKFGGENNVQFKIPPVKPKRVRIAQNENKTPKHSSGHENSTILTHADAEPHIFTGPTCINKPNFHELTSTNNNSTDKDSSRQTSKVVMRDKKVRLETEDERLQRLSVHMDEIMRGNMTAAMEIFDNLRKQEELQNILTKVEEIEQDTSNVDVSSLRSVFENVPEWVVTSPAKKPKQAKVEHRVKTAPPQNTESMSSMAHVFGDLERASEEIMNLKEQTVARLVDIEDAIKKALSSVSNLKSDSDIAGLSGLFRESLGAVQGSAASGSISKISIGSTRTATSQTQESLSAQRVTGLQVGQRSGSGPEVPGPKPRASPPSSPAFIEIQSAARKNDNIQVVTPETTTYAACQHSPNTPEKFRSTKTLKCNTAGAQGKKRDSRKGGKNKHNSKREVSVLEVQTDGNRVIGTKTENSERTDDVGNGVYSSKISAIVTTQPETSRTSLSGQVVTTSPTTNQVTTYPEVMLPVNNKP